MATDRKEIMSSIEAVAESFLAKWGIEDATEEEREHATRAARFYMSPETGAHPTAIYSFIYRNPREEA